jgi:hypothetical protein
LIIGKIAQKEVGRKAGGLLRLLGQSSAEVKEEENQNSGLDSNHGHGPIQFLLG